MDADTERDDIPSMEDLFGPEGETPPSTHPPLAIEDLRIDPASLIAPTFVPTDFSSVTAPLDDENAPDTDSEPELPKRRGRPRGSRNRSKGSEVPLNDDRAPLVSALRRKTDKELSVRAQAILVGASKIPSVVNPHIEMTEMEAQAIADPLVSYAKAHVDSERIEQFVEQWDLIAVGIASAAYGMRVVKETSDDRKSRGPRGVVRELPRRAAEPDYRAFERTDVDNHGQGSGNPDDRERTPPYVAPSEPVIGDL